MGYQEHSNKSYSEIIKDKKNSSLRAGRLMEHKHSEKKIFNYIVKRLDLKKNDNLLDIGCGAGPLCNYLTKYCIKRKINLTLNDIPEIIEFVKNKNIKSKYIKYISSEFQKKNLDKKFNKVLCYSVIQCTNNPRIFFKKILKIVGNQSLILLGDIPNTSKKMRFLKSKFGHKFEEKRIKKKIKSIKNYIKENKQNLLINDEFISFSLSYARRKGFNSYVLDQKNNFPFSYTREDILLEKF